MRILFVHPNYRSGGAEIAGTWPPAWVAYLTGHLRRAGFDDVHFIDAMTDNVGPDDLAARMAALQPDVVGVTAITPSIYAAEDVLRIARDTVPGAVRVLGGVHATFMYKQVLSEAPWVDVIVRGEGEEICTNLMSAIRDGQWPAARDAIHGLAFRDGETIKATQAASTVRDLSAIKPDWAILDWSKYIYLPLNTRVAIPNLARGCPFTCSFCSQWKFWRDYRVRDPKDVVDEIEDLVENHGVGFFILADEEPTINKKKFVAFCEELIARGLPERVKWGINTRVTDIYRDRAELAFYRKAGLVHVSLGTEAAAQMKLDVFNKETKVEENKEAIRLLREADILVEAQFIVGLDNETPETLEETFRMAWDWQPDLANWSMYTPWPFTPLFQELKDQVQVFDFSKYNFVTPIMKPAAMERGALLDGVMKNYRRFYMRKALFHYPWRGTGFRRRYLLGCLYAFLKAGVGRTFYDLGKVGYTGPQSKARVDFHFDETRELAEAQLEDWEASADKAAAAAERRKAVKAQMKDRALERTKSFKMPNGAEVRACGGGTDQMEDACEDARPDASGLIGPNAVLQLVGVLDRRAGRVMRDATLRRAGITALPDGRAMIPEAVAGRLHRQVRQDDPAHAPALLAEAGRATADYILAHRIPAPAQTLLRLLPAGPAARLLSKAIDRNAWTFAGSGRFIARSPWRFAIVDNPVIRGETAPACLCDWHAAVFERLYRRLVHPACRCAESACGARDAGQPCEFVVTRA